DHFWFSSQPALDPELPEQLPEAYAQWERAGFGERLMFATDYPHWDMDSPFESVPLTMPRETKRKILAGRATIDALPEIVAAVDGRLEILIDGGIRTGVDLVSSPGARRRRVPRRPAVPLRPRRRRRGRRRARDRAPRLRAEKDDGAARG